MLAILYRRTSRKNPRRRTRRTLSIRQRNLRQVVPRVKRPLRNRVQSPASPTGSCRNRAARRKRAAADIGKLLVARKRRWEISAVCKGREFDLEHPSRGRMPRRSDRVNPSVVASGNAKPSLVIPRTGRHIVLFPAVQSRDEWQ